MREFRSMVLWILGAGLAGYVVFGVVAGAFEHTGVTVQASEAALAGGSTFAVLTFLGLGFRYLARRMLGPQREPQAELPAAKVVHVDWKRTLRR